MRKVWMAAIAAPSASEVAVPRSSFPKERVAAADEVVKILAKSESSTDGCPFLFQVSVVCGGAAGCRRIASRRFRIVFGCRRAAAGGAVLRAGGGLDAVRNLRVLR